ncbi:FxSxx-COOH system tetratricopeptide repeat protein [Streptomyces sp. NPDC001351]|uniref:FxSxx-COOH system tetratricopeptide repeat protein n=1 Tax=Streptomyces sp. NPDC001351 TaxID=3364564 RepID=UPI00369DCE29
MDGTPRERAPGTGHEGAGPDRTDDLPHWRELADAVWLSAHWARAGRPAVADGGASDIGGPDGGTAVHTESRLPPDAPYRLPSEEAAAPPPLFTPAPEGPGRIRLGRPLLPGPERGEPTVPGRSAGLARALHRLARRVPSFDAVQLDEEVTAERGLLDGLWMPWFRPADATALDLVVLVDEAPTMAIWAAETAALSTAAEHSGAFRAVRTVNLVLPSAGEPRLRWGTARATADPGELLHGRGDRVFLVVTDGLGHGWTTPGADRLLHDLGRSGPTALVNLLPPHLRHRSSVHPHQVTLEAGGFGVPNSGLAHRPPSGGHDPLRPLPAGSDTALPVPVLSFKERSLAAWAELVAGERGTQCDLPALLVGASADTTPAAGLRAPRSRSAATDAVRRFFTLATPAARRLAGQLAVVPFEFELMEQLRLRTMPDTGPEHLAEILMGGLIDWDGEKKAPDFADGVREALLATITRGELARTIGVVGGLPAAGERGVALHIALRNPAAAALPHPAEQGWVRSELAVMKALAGPYAERAKRIEEGAGNPDGPVTDQGEASADRTQQPTEARAGMNKSMKSPALMVNVPLRNTSFVGRQTLLRAMDEQLSTQDTAAVLPHALHGLGGVGKSQLVLEYVYTHQHDYKVICWIPAEQEGLILAALATLAAQLGVAPTEQDNAGAPAAISALKALRTGVPYDDWLLVFDNAENIELVRGYFPHDGPGKVVVTSRNRGWERVATSLPVNVFERDESIELLQKRSPTLSGEDAERLADALGDLPLAVEQAGAWLGVTGMLVDEYLELLAQRSPEILEIEQAPDYPVSVAAAWDISLERIKENNPGARQLLDICASMAPEPIPRSLLRGSRGINITPEIDPLLRESIKLNRAIRDLSQFSLIKVDPRADTLQMHRLLQTVLLAKLSPQEREHMRDAAHQLLSAAKPGPYGSSLEWRDYQALLPHVLASQAVTSTDQYVRDLVHDTMWFLYYWGDHEGAAAFGRQAWSAWLAASGEEDIHVLRMTKGFAFLLRQVGQIPESIPLTEKALDVSRRIDVDPEELIDSLCDMADSYRYQGRYGEAQEVGKEATDLARSLFGPDDPASLRAAHSWAVDLRLCGRFREALELDQETARQRDLLFGPVSFFTLNSLNCVAIDMRETGRFPEARDFQEDTYRRARAALGDKHTLTLRIARNLAVCRRLDGDLAEGAKLAEETLANLRARYGVEHFDSLSAATNVSVDRRLAGDLEGSRRLAEATVTRLGRRLGESHGHTLVAKASLAATERVLGVLDAAQAHEDDVVRRLSETLGPRHVNTLTVGLGQANTAYVRVDLERAHAIDSAHLPLLTKVAGEDHPLTLSCTSNLALDLRGLGRGAEADVLQHKAVEGFARVVRSDHPWLQAARQRRRIECDIAPMPL